MARLYESWPESDVNAAIQADLMRLIAKKQSRGVETVAERMAPFIIDMTANKLLDLAHELLVARLLATALRQATGVAP